MFSNCELNTSPKLRAYTPVLSSLCSLGALGLFLRRLSSLDAFRIYDLWRSCSTCPVGQSMDQSTTIRRSSHTRRFFPSDLNTFPVDIIQTVSRMLFHSYYFEWHGLYLHPSLQKKEIGVLACLIKTDSRHNASVSTGVKIYLQFHMLLFFSLNN